MNLIVCLNGDAARLGIGPIVFVFAFYAWAWCISTLDAYSSFDDLLASALLLDGLSIIKTI